MHIYKPSKLLPVALSFEGVVNNGAPECGFVSMNAYPRFNGQEVDHDNWDRIKRAPIIQSFLKLRPLVEIAEDYMAVLRIYYTIT
jgi:hypothetical protein